MSTIERSWLTVWFHVLGFGRASRGLPAVAAVLLLAGAVLLQGCAPPVKPRADYTPLRTSIALKGEPVQPLVNGALADPKMFFTSKGYDPMPQNSSSSGGIAGALVGALFTAAYNAADRAITDAANKSRQQESERKVQPLRGKGIGEELTEYLRRKVNAIVGGPKRLNGKDAIVSNDPGAPAATAAKMPVFSFVLQDYISEDGTSQFIRVNLSYFAAGQAKAQAGRSFGYIGRLTGAVRDDAAVAEWAANREALYRQQAHQAIDTLIAIIETDLAAGSGASFSPEPGLSKITYYEPGTSKGASGIGRIMKRDGNRITMLFTSGAIANLVPDTIEPLN